MTNLLDLAMACDDADRAAKIIQDALGIESDDVVNYCFLKQWPANREQRVNIIAEWLQTEVRFLGERYGSYRGPLRHMTPVLSCATTTANSSPMSISR